MSGPPASKRMATGPSEENIPANTVVSATPNLVSTGAGDELVILNFETGQYHGLDAVGAFVWRLVLESTTIEAIERRLLAEYDVDEATGRADVDRLVRELHARGLVILDAAGA